MLFRSFFIIIFTALVHLLGAQPVKVILDTDIDSDVDDVGALAMLHTFSKHGVADILGIIVTSDDTHAVPCTDAINHYFEKPDIPIGVQKGITLKEHSQYTKAIAQEFPHTLKAYEDAQDATELYRKLLASQPDSSVVMITIGHLSNVRNLIESGPCKYSQLKGVDLIRKKVKLWSCMGGQFPAGKEANFYRPDPGSTKLCIEQWPGKVVFAGWEIGNEIITGANYLEKSLPSSSPVWRAYQRYNNFRGRQSWDQVAVLYALGNSTHYWHLSENGRCLVAADGSNTWTNELASNHSYLMEKMKPEEIAKIIDALMVGFYKSTY